MRHSSLALIGWGLLIVLAGMLLVPRHVFVRCPAVADVLIGIGFAAALNTLIDLALHSSRTCPTPKTRTGTLAHSLAFGCRLLALAAVLALALASMSS